jgi:DsbC/DsbD-like thiol-disulfide interchange protein
VELDAKLEDGWHVYGLEQVAGGPTPLQVTLDENDVVQIVGLISGSVPVKKHDSSFDLDTQFYSHAFVVRLPLRVKPHSSIGKQAIPVTIRFQACNDRTCLPPRTVHISVPFEVLTVN